MTRRIALTSRFGWRLLILGAVGVLVFGAGDAAISAPREGVDCGCEEVGSYENLEPGKLPAISDSEGTSPDGTYHYTVARLGEQIILAVTDANSNVLVSQVFTPAGNAWWGFSPDEHRFVYHYLDNMSRHHVKLFDLERNGDAINPDGYGYKTGDSELRFSPKGHYFFYAAKLSPQNNEVFVSIVDVAHPPYKIYDDIFGIVMAPAEAGLAAWGFSKTTDGGFMYAYNTSSTNVHWRLIDLTKMVVFDKGEDDTEGGDAWWGFSPCGDVFGIIEHDIKRIRLIATLDGTLLYNGGYSEMGAQLSCSLAEHLLNGVSLSSPVNNTADQECTSVPDTEPPKWPGGAKLSASNVTFTEVRLNWPDANDNVDVTQYAICKDGESVATVGEGENTYKVTKLTSGTEYTFAVKAGDAAGNWGEELTTKVTTKSMSDVSVTKIDDHDPVAVGDVIVYTVTVTNNGPDATSNVSMVDTLPGDVNFVSAVSTKGVCTESGGKVTCNIGDLGKNESATITIKVQTTEKPLYGWSERELLNTAKVTHSVTDSNVANDVAREGTTVKKPMVSVLITDWPSPVKVGYYLVYNVKVINDGPFDVTNVNLKDVLASNVEFVSVTSQRCSCTRSGAEVTCNIGQMDVNDSVAVSILVKTKEPGIISNTYTATFKDKYSVDYEVSETVETMATLWNPDFVDSVRREASPYGWCSQCGCTALAVDSLGYIHIVYVKELSSEGPSLIMYSNNIGGAWVRQQIDRGETFTGLGVAIDSDDKVHICYAQMECNEVSYECTCFVKYTNNVAESWAVPLTIFEAPVTNGDGGFISVGIDRNSKVHVGLKPNMWEDLLLYLTNTSGTWVQEELDERAYNGASMVVDHNDREHFAFYTIGIWPQGAKYITNAPDGLWRQPELLEDNWQGAQMEGMFLDIAVDSSNRPHISYVGSADQFGGEDYKYAVRQSDGSWDVALVDEGEFSSGGNCIAVDSSDKVHICYHNTACEELRYANNTSGSWVKESIDCGPIWWRGWGIGVGKDGIGVYGDVTHLCWEHKGKVIYANNIETGPDGDWEGVDDIEEQGPDGNDTGYDGNKDGVPDSQQVNVASLKSSKGDGYITIASGDGTILAGVEGVENPSPSEPPAGADFPFGFFRFTIYGVEMGGAVIVKLYLPEGAAPSTYYKYGATPNDANEHWYEFLYDGQTGAEIANNVITLHLVDGGRGDGDLTANAIIVEPGGPGWPGGPEKCIVDFDDLQRFCQQWLMTGVEVSGDLDKNKTVDFVDYSIFAEQWLDECPFAWPLK